MPPDGGGVVWSHQGIRKRCAAEAGSAARLSPLAKPPEARQCLRETSTRLCPAGNRKAALTDLLRDLVQFLGDHPEYAGLVAFMIAMGEALLIVGLFVPSTVPLVAAGTLWGWESCRSGRCWRGSASAPFSAMPSPMDRLHLARSLEKLVAPGSLSGNGSKGRGLLPQVWRHEHLLRALRAGDQGGHSRIAGMAGMTPLRFTVINVLSGIAWALAHLIPGVTTGALLGLLGAVSGRLAIVIGGLLLFVFLAVAAVRWLVQIFLPLFAGRHAAAVAWCRCRPGRLTQGCPTFDPSHPRSVGMTVSVLLLLAAMAAFFYMAGETETDGPLALADQSLHNLVAGLRTVWMDHAMVFLTMLGDGVVMVAGTLVVTAYLLCGAPWTAGTSDCGGRTHFSSVFKRVSSTTSDRAALTGATVSLSQRHAPINTVLIGVSRYLSPTTAALFQAVVLSFSPRLRRTGGVLPGLSGGALGIPTSCSLLFGRNGAASPSCRPPTPEKIAAVCWPPLVPPLAVSAPHISSSINRVGMAFTPRTA
jgi:undecaprenyl-diphosphatase